MAASEEDRLPEDELLAQISFVSPSSKNFLGILTRMQFSSLCGH